MSKYNEERVLSVHHWTDTLFSFRTTRDPSFRFRNGEFTMIGIEVEGRPLLRAYSVVSANYEEELEFFSIKVPNGPLTSNLQHLKVGDPIMVGKKPTGTLVLDNLLPGRHLYLLGTGTGLAPFMSIIKDPETYERFEKVVLVHGCRQVAELAYGETITEELPNHEFLGEAISEQLIYYPTVTREPFRNSGRITDLMVVGQAVRRHRPAGASIAEADRFMLCGSPEMIRDTRELLTAAATSRATTARPATTSSRRPSSRSRRATPSTRQGAARNGPWSPVLKPFLRTAFIVDPRSERSGGRRLSRVRNPSRRGPHDDAGAVHRRGRHRDRQDLRHRRPHPAPAGGGPGGARAQAPGERGAAGRGSGLRRERHRPAARRAGSGPRRRRRSRPARPGATPRALAPDLAAAREGRGLALDDLVALVPRAASRRHPRDTVLIEGVGGLMSPITPTATGLDWLKPRSALPVLLVSGSYLGAISHALTAVETLRAHGDPRSRRSRSARARVRRRRPRPSPRRSGPGSGAPVACLRRGADWPGAFPGLGWGRSPHTSP